VSVAEPRKETDRYTLLVGKQTQVEYAATAGRQCFENRDGEVMCIAIRLFDDGFAYRYEFPGESTAERVVTAEYGGVRFFETTRAWLQPKANAQTGWSNVNPSYEEDYVQDVPVGTPSPTESGWIYPALFRYGDSWIVLTEAGMDGSYPGTNLAAKSDDGLYRIRFPQAAEVTTGGRLLAAQARPFHTPWRILVTGDLPTIAASTIGTDLAEPSTVDDTGFIRPGIAAWSWGVLKDDSVVYPVQQAFVDYAASMNWPYVLVDADWDRNIGYDKIAELAHYAADRGIGLLLWYNSSGDWNETVYSPKSRLLTREDRRAEFARIRSLGIRGIKVDFFPGDGASVFRYCADILADAADYELMVNFHGTTLPRGLQRTFPNFVTSEAVKGFEFVTFEQPNADTEATRAAMLPFTRNLFDPMDYTPTVLGDIPGIERRTSNAFQLALPVVFWSGVQHLVATPAQMESMPDFVQDYLRQLPTTWDESRLLDGFPGRFAIVARRAGGAWYVAGINAGSERRFEIDLPFAAGRRATLIRDGAEAGTLRKLSLTGTSIAIDVPAGSGFVVVVDPASGD
jgi:alpha-glucosidase